MPYLWPELLHLNCQNNVLASTPSVWPSGLLTLRLRSNRLTSISTFGTTLQFIDISSNMIEELPEIPQSCRFLNVSDNQLRELPILPDALKYLNISRNWISHIESPWPSGLTSLYCSGMQLTMGHDGSFPDSLTELDVTDNMFKWLPELPPTLTVLFARQNPFVVCSNDVRREIPTLIIMCADMLANRHELPKYIIVTEIFARMRRCRDCGRLGYPFEKIKTDALWRLPVKITRCSQCIQSA